MCANRGRLRTSDVGSCGRCRHYLGISAFRCTRRRIACGEKHPPREHRRLRRAVVSVGGVSGRRASLYLGESSWLRTCTARCRTPACLRLTATAGSETRSSQRRAIINSSPLRSSRISSRFLIDRWCRIGGFLLPAAAAKTFDRIVGRTGARRFGGGRVSYPVDSRAPIPCGSSVRPWACEPRGVFGGRPSVLNVAERPIGSLDRPYLVSLYPQRGGCDQAGREALPGEGTYADFSADRSTIGELANRQTPSRQNVVTQVHATA